MNGKYKICTRCIMDTSDPVIQFDERGVCNHCRTYEEREKQELFYNENGQRKLEVLVNRIKEEGKGKEYDCLIGVSGGVDSTFLAYQVKKLGLRPLALHLDNGWNSELSIGNIENILKKLGIDLYTHVINWEEFKDLQLSFLRSSVPNCEIPTDHAVVSLFFKVASEKKIRYLIRGGNLVTEGILPSSWGYDAKDLRHIKAIYKRFGKGKLKTLPRIGLCGWAYYTFVKKLKFIPLLNYIPYNKDEAKKLIMKELGWRDYGGKHYESIYTRFFQGYILPTKFGFDKRRAHLSTLICSGQLTRDAALEEMKKDPYPSEKMMKEDRDYVIKKFELTESDFNSIMEQPVKSFRDYPNNSFFLHELSFLTKLAKKTISAS